MHTDPETISATWPSAPSPTILEQRRADFLDALATSGHPTHRLNLTQWRILAHAGDWERIGHLAVLLGHSASSIRQSADRIISAGLLEERATQADRRLTYLRRTPAATRLLAALPRL